MPEKTSSEPGFEPCEICGARNWSVLYRGPIRDGAFATRLLEDATVARCGNCGAGRLREEACKPADFYTSGEYRQVLNENLEAAAYFAEHDCKQIHHLEAFAPKSLRGAVVADIGCGAGSFLDHVSGLAGEIIAAEPAEAFHDSLRGRGYHVFPFAADASPQFDGRVDFAFSFSVIAHVPSPVRFLRDIAVLLAPGGELLIGLDNRNDILLELLAGDYAPFYYRTFHRWYFDADSFARCAQAAGLEVVDRKFFQQYGPSNAIKWLRDRKPGGHDPLPHLDDRLLDFAWRESLQSAGVSNYVFFTLRHQT